MIDLVNEELNLEKKEFPGYNQAELMLEVALEVQEAMVNFPTVHCKLGFESGSAIGGIIGEERLQFCLFGETVKHADLMCSRVNVFFCYRNLCLIAILSLFISGW